MRVMLFLTYLLICCFSFGQSDDLLKIGLNGGNAMSDIQILIREGSYALSVDGVGLAEISEGQRCRIRKENGALRILVNGKSVGSGKRAVMQSLEWESSFRLSQPEKAGYVYPDNLTVRVTSTGLKAVNECSAERYVGGVTEAESGGGRELEFYKVQAIIARTYALANKRRHENQGFHLCDQVHCQAYHGMSRFEEKIPLAVNETHNYVLVDPEINLITAAFHANCGGHTLNAEHVWSRPLSYLVGREDTFCLVMPQSHWEKDIPKSRWLGYLSEQQDIPLATQADSLAVLAYYPRERTRFFQDSLHNLLMTRIRRDLKLRSAFFVVEDEGQSVHITGRGFGHGVGLCQEGAMRMAELGYSHQEILHFYYKDVHLIDKKHLEFFLD